MRTRCGERKGKRETTLCARTGRTKSKPRNLALRAHLVKVQDRVAPAFRMVESRNLHLLTSDRAPRRFTDKLGNLATLRLAVRIIEQLLQPRGDHESSMRSTSILSRRCMRSLVRYASRVIRCHSAAPFKWNGMSAIRLLAITDWLQQTLKFPQTK